MLMTKKLWLMVMRCLVLGAFAATSACAYEHNADIQKVDGQWDFIWGDLPYDEARQQWVVEQENWRPTEHPEGPEGRQGEHILWLRWTPPDGAWRDPHVYITSIDLTAQVFIDHQMIYHFGYISNDGNSEFAGWPWHLIALPSDYSQKFIYFRVFSDYPYIGLAGDILIGNQSELLSRVYRLGFSGVLIVFAIVLVALICMALGLLKRMRAVAMATGTFSLNLALMMFAENPLSQLVWFEPLTWRMIAAFCYFLIPAFLALIAYTWFRREAPRVCYVVFAISIFFTAVVAVLSATGVTSFVNAYPVFDGLFILLVLGLFIGCYRNFHRVGVEGRLISWGIFTVLVSLVIDMLSAHEIIVWLDRMGQWGLFLFSLASLSMHLVLVRRQNLKLAELNQTLESKVQARTEELEQSHQQLKRIAREDYLTKVLNRRAFVELAIMEIHNALRHQRALSLVMLDIDYFKQVNDRFGHVVGDRVLSGVAAVAKDVTREGDLLGRYGGEEFVILLHATPLEQASHFCERLRQTLSQQQFYAKEGDLVHVTASIGFASLCQLTMDIADPGKVLDILLQNADQALYQAKETGRDKVMAYDSAVVNLNLSTPA